MAEESATLLTYRTQKENFESVYERNKFYRGLFGYTQTVKRNGKRYEYEKDGLMDEIPHLRIDDSVFIVPEEAADRVVEYFEEWGEKVSYHCFTVLIDEKEILDKIQEEGEN
ncbi:MAG: hypothetical protein ABEJ93_02540 [Candidatus Nanohalobium sp.]